MIKEEMGVNVESNHRSLSTRVTPSYFDLPMEHEVQKCRCTNFVYKTVLVPFRYDDSVPYR